MTPRKKLIEVALPLEAINAAATRENFIYKGNPSALHKWWAQRPLAACRAVLFASLVDDPDSDPRCRMPDGRVDVERAAEKRAKLFNLIADLVRWENSNNPRVLNEARKEIARSIASRKIETGELAKNAEAVPGVTAWDFVIGQAEPEAVNAFLVKYAPPVLDPFCGGGSIPLEAQRLGLVAEASDLNPVAVLITKALIEIPPKFAGRPPVNPESRKRTSSLNAWPGATGLAEDVRHYGSWIRDEADKRLRHLYPSVKITKAMAKGRPDLEPYVGQELTAIAWLWARTVASPNPICKGAHVPLVRSFSLSTRRGRQAWVEPIIDHERGTYRFEVRVGEGTPPAGTVGKKGDRCLLTGVPIPRQHIRSEGQAQRLKCRLLAIVAETPRGRVYLSPTEDHEQLALQVAAPDGAADSAIVGDPRYLTPTSYGMNKYRDLFTSRQLLALVTLRDLIGEAASRVQTDSGGDERYAAAVATYLAFAVDKAVEYNCSLIPWYAGEDRPHHLFSRQAIPMVWDFAELNPLGEIGGSFSKSLKIVVGVLDGLPSTVCPGTATQRNVTDVQVTRLALLSTDPPYYDNVPYADLSDFFYVWLRQMLHQSYPDSVAARRIGQSIKLQYVAV
jgi:putative DNA methylase